MIHAVLFGCGTFARRYHLPSLLADPGVRIAAICDPFPAEPVRELAARTGAALVAAPEALPDPPGTVLALVSTPHALHAPHVAAALARGWHVLCDKPFVVQATEGEALAAQAAQRGKINAVAFNRRFDRGFRRARAALAAGAIGAPRFVQAVQLGYEKGGWILDPTLAGAGPFLGRASHMADIIPWLLGRAADAVRARLREGPPGRTDLGGLIELLFGGLECHIACLEEGWHMWDELRIFGDDGLIELRRPLGYPLGWSFRQLTSRGEAVEELAAEAEHGGATRDMLAALRSGGQVACDFAASMPSVRLIEAALESARGASAWQRLTA